MYQNQQGDPTDDPGSALQNDSFHGIALQSLQFPVVDMG
jgi:hypothetical protein